jgi:hypothetical protein
MRVLIAAIALLVLGVLGWCSGYAEEAKGELRCEGAGVVVINVDGKDYAVNGMASSRYPPAHRQHLGSPECSSQGEAAHSHWVGWGLHISKMLTQNA